MLSNFFGTAARGGKIGELFINIAGFIVVRDSSPAIKHSEIGHCTQKLCFSRDSVDCFRTYRHIFHIPNHSVGAMHELIKILPVILHSGAIGSK